MGREKGEVSFSRNKSEEEILFYFALFFEVVWVKRERGEGSVI